MALFLVLWFSVLDLQKFASSHVKAEQWEEKINLESHTYIYFHIKA